MWSCATPRVARRRRPSISTGHSRFDLAWQLQSGGEGPRARVRLGAAKRGGADEVSAFSGAVAASAFTNAAPGRAGARTVVRSSAGSTFPDCQTTRRWPRGVLHVVQATARRRQRRGRSTIQRPSMIQRRASGSAGGTNFHRTVALSGSGAVLAGDLPGGDGEVVRRVGRGDRDHQRGELRFGVAAGGLVPDRVGDRVGASASRVAASLSARAARSASLKYGVSRQVATVRMRSLRSPACASLRVWRSTHTLRPLSWLARSCPDRAWSRGSGPALVAASFCSAGTPGTLGAGFSLRVCIFGAAVTSRGGPAS
jgi:hypothetical protein